MDAFAFDTLCNNGFNERCTQFLFSRTIISIITLIYIATKASQLYTLIQQGKNSQLNSIIVYLECFTSLKIIIYSWYRNYSYFSYLEYLTIFAFNIAILFVWLKSQTSTNFIIKSTIRLILSVCLYFLILRRLSEDTIQFFVHCGTVLIIIMFGNELLDFFSSYYNFSSIMQPNPTIPSQIFQKQHPKRVSRFVFVLQLLILTGRMWSLSVEYPQETVLQSHYLIKFVCTTLLLIQVIVLNQLSKNQPTTPQAEFFKQQQTCQDKVNSIAQFNSSTSPALQPATEQLRKARKRPQQ